MIGEVQQIVEAVTLGAPGVEHKIRTPRDLAGRWFIDFDYRGTFVVVEFKAGEGYVVELCTKTDAYAETSYPLDFARAAIDTAIALLRTSGTWAYTEDARIFVPEIRVDLMLGDQAVPLRGYEFVVAIRRRGRIVGWRDKE